jgi:hypothetical protein
MAVKRETTDNVITYIIEIRRMHGVNSVKLINAQQATEINNYKNTKEKLLWINAANTVHLAGFYFSD